MCLLYESKDAVCAHKVAILSLYINKIILCTCMKVIKLVVYVITPRGERIFMLKGEQGKTNHYKMYKAGKKWSFAILAVVSFLTGGAITSGISANTQDNAGVSTVNVAAPNTVIQQATGNNSAMTTKQVNSNAVQSSSFSANADSQTSQSAESKQINSVSSAMMNTLSSSKKSSSDISNSTENVATKTVQSDSSLESKSDGSNTSKEAPTSSSVSNASFSGNNSSIVSQNPSAMSISTSQATSASETQSQNTQNIQTSGATSDAVVTQASDAPKATAAWPTYYSDMKVGGTQKINIATTPANGTYDLVLYKSSNEKILTVDTQGVVTAVGPGDASVNVSILINGMFQVGITNFHVYPVDSYITNAYITAPKGQLEVGQMETLAMHVLPVDLKHNTPVWTAQTPDIATIDKYGNVTALRPGTAKFMGAVADMHGTWLFTNTQIQVISLGANEVTGFTVTVPKYYLEKGNQEQLSYETTPNKDWPFESVTWTSSNPQVATVDKTTGLLTAVGEGDVSILFTGYKYNGGYWSLPSTIHVYTANEDFKSGHVIWPDFLKTGLSRKATFVPNGNVTKVKSVVWSTSDPSIATINNDGVIKALAPGNVIFSVRAAGYNGKIMSYMMQFVIQPSVAIESASLQPAKSQLGIGELEQLNVVLVPKNADVQGNEIWTSSNPDVVTIDKTGRVTAHTAGSAVIKAVVQDDFGKTLNVSTTLNVLPAKKVTTLSIEGSGVVNMGRKTPILTNIQSDQDGYQSIEWQSSDTSVMTVDNDGNVTGLLPGTVTLTATVKDLFGQTLTISRLLTVELDLPANFESQRAQINATILNFNKTLKSLGVNYTQLTPFDGNRWGKTTLTYSVANPTTVYHASDGDLTYQQIWEAAAYNWNAGLKILGSNITLQETTGNADIPGVIEFDPGSKNLGGTGVYGIFSINNKFVPGVGKITLFGTSMDSQRYTRGQIISVLMHEMGHALGLWHSPSINSVMWFAAASQMVQPADVLSVMLESQLPAGLTSHIIGLDDYSNGVDNV